ncbi:hypothetical protein H0H93_004811 [Arthromyces matolae]|nr:hypothetical protein H0H93_004811 [Arthromyces matolae]
MLARRRAAIAAGVDIGPGDPWVFRRHDMVANPCDEVRRLKPVWSETWVEKPDLGREERKNSTVDGSPLMKWEDIMPLGATLTLPEREPEPTAEVPASEQEKARRRSSTVSSWISSFSASKNTATVRDEPSPPRVPIEEGLRDPEAEVDVVVMIAMPRSPDTRGYEFGVTSLPVTVNEPEEPTPVHVS